MKLFKNYFFLDWGSKLIRYSVQWQFCIGFVLMGFIPIQSHALEAGRLALVIGNDAYQHVAPLGKSVNDAVAMAQELKLAGFEVELVKNVNSKTLQRTIDAFSRRIGLGDEVVVFYAGHGVQIDSCNFLMPVDIQIESKSDVQNYAYYLDNLTAKVASTQVSIALFIIDASNINPFSVSDRTQSIGRCLPSAGPLKNQMLVFSAGTGQDALDFLGNKDTNPNGLFTRELLVRMRTPNMEIKDLMLEVQEAVEKMAKTVNHAQRPLIFNNSDGNFYFYRSSVNK